MKKLILGSICLVLIGLGIISLNGKLLLANQVIALSPPELIPTSTPDNNSENPIGNIVIRIYDNNYFGHDDNRIRINQNRKLSVIAYDHNHNPIFDGIAYDWHMSSTNSIGNLWLDNSNDRIASFDATTIGIGDIFVTARMGNWNKTGSIRIEVINYCEMPPSCHLDTCKESHVDPNWCPNTHLPGDVNWDNTVNLKDVREFEYVFRLLANAERWSVADFNLDKKTDIFDFSYLIKNFGFSLEIPEDSGVTPEIPPPLN